uniref:Uncharacterized protein n=1 Tax=Acrobeloides nanus TaxID=290746 RepID=A0A914CFC4_9BILA
MTRYIIVYQINFPNMVLDATNGTSAIDTLMKTPEILKQLCETNAQWIVFSLPFNIFVNSMNNHDFEGQLFIERSFDDLVNLLETKVYIDIDDRIKKLDSTEVEKEEVVEALVLKLMSRNQLFRLLKRIDKDNQVSKEAQNPVESENCIKINVLKQDIIQYNKAETGKNNVKFFEWFFTIGKHLDGKLSGWWKNGWVFCFALREFGKLKVNNPQTPSLIMQFSNYELNILRIHHWSTLKKEICEFSLDLNKIADPNEILNNIMVTHGVSFIIGIDGSPIEYVPCRREVIIPMNMPEGYFDKAKRMFKMLNLNEKKNKSAKDSSQDNDNQPGPNNEKEEPENSKSNKRSKLGKMIESVFKKSKMEDADLEENFNK